MKLTVQLTRGTDGLLRAYVVQQATRGSNLLDGKRIREVPQAEIEIQRRLRGCELKFVEAA